MDIAQGIYPGSEKDFEIIVNQNKLIVYSTVIANLYGTAEVDDIVQETFIYAYYNFQALRDLSKLTGWLCGIARNKSRSFNKKHGRTVCLDDFCGGEAEPVTLSAEEIVIENYNRAEIMRGITGLSEKLRETVTLYYIGEKSTREISEILMIPEGTVRFRLAEARKKLKQELKELVNIMSTEKKEIADNELYAKVQENINKANEYANSNKKKEASELCDKTFEMLKKHPEFISKEIDADDEPKMLLYNLYHAKANAVFLIEDDVFIEYLKKALDIAEELANKKSDWAWLANEYYYYALRVGDKDKADEYLNKAVECAKKTENRRLYAMCLFWKTNGNIAAGFEGFREITGFKDDLFNKNDIYIYALSNGFCKILTALKDAGVDISDESVEYASVCPGIKYEDGKALLWGEPGSSRTCVDWKIGRVIEDLFVHADFGNHIILDNDFKPGYKFEGEGFSYSFNPTKYITEVISTDEKISVAAGEFEDCIHVRKTVTLTDSDDDKSRKAELNRDTNGVRDVWFAPNVGIVKMTFQTISGNKDHFELNEYKIDNTNETELCKKYLPIALGNTWKYVSFDRDGNPFSNKFEYENVFEVEYVSEEFNAISNWGYDYPKK